MAGPVLTSPKLLFFQTFKRKGIFLTLFHEGILGEPGVGNAEAKEGEGPRAGLGASREPLGTAFPSFVPSPVKFFKSSKQQEGQWSSLYRVISSVSGEDQSSESCSSKGEGKRKKMGGEGKKNSLDQFPLANTITRLPGSSASCWQACWPPASLAQLPAAPRLPPEWGGLAGVKAPHTPWLGLLSTASQGCCKPHWYLPTPFAQPMP